jgi:uncharacterized NAD-dependent epimerase/dehydratase family protein
VPLIALDQAIPAYLSAARLTNPQARFVGISLNTSAMNEAEATEVLKSTSQSLGLPCVDPIRTGVEPIAAALQAFAAG